MAGFNFQRGCVYRVNGGGGDSLVRVTPGFGGAGNILTTGVQSSDTDLVLPVATLEGFKILYTFGEDFGQFNIIGMCLLGADGANSGSVSAVTGWFSTNRVSRLQDTVTVTLGGGGAYKLFATGLQIAEPDPEYHIQPFSISCMIAKAP